MAGGLTISTLNDSSGVLATQNGMTGLPKAWVRFTASTTPSITGSFNVSSVTYTATAIYTINFTTAMPNANYSVTSATSYNNSTGNNLFGVAPYSLGTSSFNAQTWISSGVGVFLSGGFVCLAVHSS